MEAELSTDLDTFMRTRFALQMPMADDKGAGLPR